MAPSFPESREGDESWAWNALGLHTSDKTPRNKHGEFGRRISPVNRVTTGSGREGKFMQVLPTICRTDAKGTNVPGNALTGSMV